MSDLIIKKSGTDYNLPMLAEHYPADRVYLHGDITEDIESVLDKASSYTYVASETALPTIPNITKYKNITFALQIPNTARLFNIYTLPTDLFKQNRFLVNTIWQSGSVEIGYSSDTTLSINWDNWSGIGWGLAVILSN